MIFNALMKIGLYFGSFNPVHIGHLIIANYVLNETDLDKIWFVVSPQNPFKKNKSLLNEYDRLHLIRTAIEDDTRMKASDIEFYLPKPSYTINTLTYLKEKYPEQDFYLIMGSDSFQNIDKWKNYEMIINNYKLYVYQRKGFDLKNNNNSETIKLLDAPLLEISATNIRQLVKQGKSIRYMVPEKIREEIEGNLFFKR